MTGNQDTATRVAAWAVSRIEDFMPIIDECVEVLKAAPPGSGDIPAAEKRGRAVGVLARSVGAVVALSSSPRSRGGRQQEEDEMKHRDDSPENLERMRAELAARLDRLDATFEAKRIVVEPGCWPTPRPDREPVHAS